MYVQRISTAPFTEEILFAQSPVALQHRTEGVNNAQQVLFIVHNEY